VTRLAQKVKLWFEQQQQEHDFNVPKMLLHKDVTPSNMLVQGNNTFLIDWEFRDFGDPMTDFSTGFWDMDLNEGKWRIALTESEREQLYAGYQDAGGKLDEAKVDTWMTFDKIGVAVFLCLRIYSPPEDTTPELQAQYRKDLDAIISSLEQKF
jgi:aminoglycoside phosphotransferase (APT) family kinase protein